MDERLRSSLQDRLERQKLPPMIVLDVTNTCNLACVHCPQPLMQAAPGFKPKHFHWDHFVKIADEIREHDQPVLLRLTGEGEPTVHPRLFEMIRHAKANCRATVNLTTNGVLLTPKRIETLLDCRIDLIDVSLDALTRPTYERVRRGGSFERVTANLFYLLDRRREAKVPTRVMVSFIAQAENEHEETGFREFWSPLVDHVMVRSLHSAVGAINRAKSAESAVRNDARLPERFPCAHLWKRLTVDFTGTVKFCAHEWLGSQDVVVGHIERGSLASIWAGEALSQIRAIHRSNQHRPGFICTNCTDWAASKWDFGYERLVDRVVHGAPRLMPELPLLD